MHILNDMERTSLLQPEGVLCTRRPSSPPAKPAVVLPVFLDRILLVDMGVHLVVNMKQPETLIQLGVPGLELRMLFHKPLRTQQCVSAGQLRIPSIESASSSVSRRALARGI